MGNSKIKAIGFRETVPVALFNLQVIKKIKEL